MACRACGAPGMLQSLEHQKIECLDAVSTIADGIAGERAGELYYRTCKQYLDGVVTVTEDEICAAILALIEQHKLIAEGAGAVSVAAAMFNKVPVKGARPFCVVSGGNIDVTILSRVINRGLSKSGRIYTFAWNWTISRGSCLWSVRLPRRWGRISSACIMSGMMIRPTSRPVGCVSRWKPVMRNMYRNSSLH